ncbi:parallel beta-helix repeat protein, partial [Rhodopirellula maiorica SM1]
MKNKNVNLFMLAVTAFTSSILLANEEPSEGSLGNRPKDSVTFYVAVDANGDGNGTSSDPFQSLEQARDGIRAARKSCRLRSDQPVTVRIGPGVYRRSSSFQLSAEDSGTAGAPVVYRATKPGSVRIRGSVALSPSAFTSVSDDAIRSRLDDAVRDDILVCDISESVSAPFASFKTSFRGVPVAPWLYVNHHPKPLARWPNLGTPEQGW